MRLRVDITIGPLQVIFDPFPEADVEEEDEPSPASGLNIDSTGERDPDRPIPELHIGFRSGEE